MLCVAPSKRTWEESRSGSGTRFRADSWRRARLDCPSSLLSCSAVRGGKGGPGLVTGRMSRSPVARWLCEACATCDGKRTREEGGEGERGRGGREKGEMAMDDGRRGDGCHACRAVPYRGGRLLLGQLGAKGGLNVSLERRQLVFKGAWEKKLGRLVLRLHRVADDAKVNHQAARGWETHVRVRARRS